MRVYVLLKGTQEEIVGVFETLDIAGEGMEALLAKHVKDKTRDEYVIEEWEVTQSKDTHPLQWTPPAEED